MENPFHSCPCSYCTLGLRLSSEGSWRIHTEICDTYTLKEWNLSAVYNQKAILAWKNQKLDWDNEAGDGGKSRSQID